jgi:hypothetical protein
VKKLKKTPFFRNFLISALRFFEASLKVLIELLSFLFSFFNEEQFGQLSSVVIGISATWDDGDANDDRCSG